MWIWWVLGILLAVGLVLAVCWPRLRRFGSEIQVERAREMFKLQRSRLEPEFLKAAQATGKPRGLRWCECQWTEVTEFARDRQSGQLVALVGVTIRFEAIEGSDMEGLPAVANLRNASAVFFFHQGRWRTQGKVVFNLNPDEAIHHFAQQYERL